MTNSEIFFRAYLWELYTDARENEEYNNREDGVEIRDIDFSAISEETEFKSRVDCNAFLAMAKDLIDDDDPILTPNGEGPYDDAGYFFWHNRVGSGRSFDDGEWPKHGEELYRIAKTFREVSPYLGDDGRIYIG